MNDGLDKLRKVYKEGLTEGRTGKKKEYPRGLSDVCRLFSRLDSLYKKDKREQWLREHYGKGDKQKGGDEASTEPQGPSIQTSNITKEESE